MNTSRRHFVTAGITLALFLSGLEITVVGTAAPRIVRELGGIDHFSWIFAAYLLTSTLGMPLWGRAADHWGRKKPFLATISIFLLGSIACALSQNMTQLILARALKGIGGGGIVPIGFTVAADLYDRHGRARIQGILSSSWGIASIVGPFIGGALADALGWRSIFWLNLIPGTLALVIVYIFLHESKAGHHALNICWRSISSSTAFVLSLLLGLKFLQAGSHTSGVALICAGVPLFLIFAHNERHAAHPLVPNAIRTRRIFLVGCASGFFGSILVLGLGSFGPLLFQSGYQYSTTVSGLLLVPFSVSWVIAGMISTRLMLRVSARKLILFGSALTVSGFGYFMLAFQTLNTVQIITCMIIMGTGMAFNYPIFLIAVQHDAPPNQVAFATAALTWVRNLGATIGTTVMGLTLSLSFRENAHAENMPIQINQLKEDALNLIHNNPILAQAFFKALFTTFLVMFVATLINAAITLLFPQKDTRVFHE